MCCRISVQKRDGISCHHVDYSDLFFFEVLFALGDLAYTLVLPDGLLAQPRVFTHRSNRRHSRIRVFQWLFRQLLASGIQIPLLAMKVLCMIPLTLLYSATSSLFLGVTEPYAMGSLYCSPLFRGPPVEPTRPTAAGCQCLPMYLIWTKTICSSLINGFCTIRRSNLRVLTVGIQMPSLRIMARDWYWKGLDSRGHQSKPPYSEFYNFSLSTPSASTILERTFAWRPRTTCGTRSSA